MNFAHGHFYGHYQRQRVLGPMALAELAPTVPEHAVEAHTHEDAHLLLLLDGDYLSSAQGMPAVANGPTLILNPPGTHHRDCFRGETGRFFTISLTPERWADLASLRRLPSQALRLGAGALMRATAVLQELRCWDTQSPLAVECQLEALIDDAATELQSDSARAPSWLLRVREQLSDQWRAQPGIADLARTADVHPVYLARAFRRHFGCTPADYLRVGRLERAVDALRNSKRKVTEVAADCGFADHSHLTRAFSKRYGCTPQQFRLRLGLG